jgi:chromosome segregation ATPase
LTASFEGKEPRVKIRASHARVPDRGEERKEARMASQPMRDPEQIQQEIRQTEGRLAEAVETLAYKKAHLKEDLKEAVESKKEELTERLSEAVEAKRDELKEAVTTKASDLKGAVTTKKDELKDAVTTKTDDLKEAVAAKKDELKDAVVTKTDDLKEAAVAAKDKVAGAVEKAKDAIASKVGGKDKVEGYPYLTEEEVGA